MASNIEARVARKHLDALVTGWPDASSVEIPTQAVSSEWLGTSCIHTGHVRYSTSKHLTWPGIGQRSVTLHRTHLVMKNMNLPLFDLEASNVTGHRAASGHPPSDASACEKHEPLYYRPYVGLRSLIIFALDRPILPCFHVRRL
jgi:hypothetical protein